VLALDHGFRDEHAYRVLDRVGPPALFPLSARQGTADVFPWRRLPIVKDQLAGGIARIKPLLAESLASPAVIPSLLMCDFAHLADEVHRVEEAGVSGLHLDCMDGHFVPNLSYGALVVEAVRRTTDLPLEAHLMISEPERLVDDFVAAGADLLTIHFEATADCRAVLRQIRAAGAAAGLAINPPTPVERIFPLLDECDLVLVMSVHPGFGGQQFESSALAKLSQLRSVAPAHLALEVDGGVNPRTIAACTQAGAGMLVVGSAIFAQADYVSTVDQLSRLARGQATASPHRK